MREFVVGPQEHGAGLVRHLCARYPALTPGVVLRALRKKDIRINGQRVSTDRTLVEGDRVTLYLPASTEMTPAARVTGDPGDAGGAATAIREVFRGGGLLIVEKPQGMAVHAGARVRSEPLIDALRRRYDNAALTLCHRLDQGTGGLVMLAFDPATLAAAQDLMKKRLIRKFYRALAHGAWPAHVGGADGFATYDAWLEKPARQSRVYIHDAPAPGRLPIRTRVRCLRVLRVPDGDPVSELEIELVTGRTHQIRAHLAWLGHPILGDALYGRNLDNRRFHEAGGGRLRRQQLFATALCFGAVEKNHRLAWLSNRQFSISPPYTVAIDGL